MLASRADMRTVLEDYTPFVQLSYPRTWKRLRQESARRTAEVVQQELKAPVGSW